MVKYGKTAQHAISIVSYLVEKQSDGELVGSREISEVRHLPKPVVAKLLTILSQSGFLTGFPGPNGGYRLAKPADSIFLLDIVNVFEQTDSKLQCPFGPHWCGNGDPCPMHDELEAFSNRLFSFLKNTSVAIFSKKQS